MAPGSYCGGTDRVLPKKLTGRFDACERALSTLRSLTICAHLATNQQTTPDFSRENTTFVSQYYTRERSPQFLLKFTRSKKGRHKRKKIQASSHHLKNDYWRYITEQRVSSICDGPVAWLSIATVQPFRKGDPYKFSTSPAGESGTPSRYLPPVPDGHSLVAR
ncbi:hypothetical protein Bbelb_278930 [Branchiostoma belcheri]|nr:hypothetical protein Bbelb_278930 [Branchiostoma belcheri]